MTIAYEIQDRASLMEWLRTQPIEASQLISFRAALRVVPFISVDAQIEKTISPIVLPTLWAIAATLAALLTDTPKENIIHQKAFGASANASNAVAFPSPYAAAFALNVFLRMGESPEWVIAADAARHAADAIYSAITELEKDQNRPLLRGPVAYELINQDALYFQALPDQINPIELLSAPLWMSSGDSFLPELKKKAEDDWLKIKKRLTLEDENAWAAIKWYEQLLNDGPTFNAKYEYARLQAFEAHYDDQHREECIKKINAALVEVEDSFFPQKVETLNVPAQISASVRAVWKNNIITIDAAPVGLDLSSEMAMAVLQSLKSQLGRFADTFRGRQSQKNNIDWSWIDDVAEAAALIPENVPDRVTLFELAIYEKKLSRYLNRLDNQTDEAIVDKFGVLVESFSDCLTQFPDIRNYRRSQLRIDLSEIPEEDRSKIVVRLSELFSSQDGQGVIDLNLTNTIKNIGAGLIDYQADSELVLDVQTDQIESFANTFKELLNGLENNENAGKLVRALEHVYLNEFSKSLEPATREIAREDAKILSKAAIRAKQAEVGVAHYGPKLLDILPKHFNWLRRALKLPEK